MVGISKRDPLPAVSAVYKDLIDLLSSRRGSIETFYNFELRLAAQVAKFHAIGLLIALHESFIALMLLTNYNIDSAECISTFAAIAPSVDS